MGQLMDPYTPYAWTQDTSRGFPKAALVTGQDIRHGQAPYNVNVEAGTYTVGECFGIVTEYLKTDVQPPSGITCSNFVPFLGGKLSR